MRMSRDGFWRMGTRADEQTGRAGEATAGSIAIASGAVSGSSYSRHLKALATVIVVVSCGLLLGIWSNERLNAPPNLVGVLLGALVVLFAGWWDLLSSRTSIDDRAIRQIGLWRREVQIANITACQLVHVPKLEWLIAPRLIVRSGGYGVKTFYVSDQAVLEAVKELIRPRSR